MFLQRCFRQNFSKIPTPTYAYHRDRPPLQALASRPAMFMAFAYLDCLALFRDARLTSRRPAYSLIGHCSDAVLGELSPFTTHIQRWLLQLDALRRRVEVIVERLLNNLEQSSEPDLIREFAYPLPVQVISKMLGLSEELYERCTLLTNDIASWFGNVLRSPERARVAFKVISELEGYFTELIRKRRVQPSNDLMSQMMTVAEDGERLSEEDLQAQCVMMLFARHETTRHLIGNGMYKLLSHQQSLQQIGDDLTLIPNAIEEILRY